MLNFY